MTRTLCLIASLFLPPAQPPDVPPLRQEPICGTVTAYRTTKPPSGGCDLHLTVTPSDAPTMEVTIGDAVRRQLPRKPWEYFKRDICVWSRFVSAVSQVELTPPDAAQTFGAGAVSLCDGAIVPPRLLNNVKPQYTLNAMREKVHGDVHIDMVVDAEGRVGATRITQSLHPEIDAEALKAVRQWLFAPATRDGAPVAVVIDTEMQFRLAPDRKRD